MAAEAGAVPSKAELNWDGLGTVEVAAETRAELPEAQLELGGVAAEAIAGAVTPAWAWRGSRARSPEAPLEAELDAEEVAAEAVAGPSEAQLHDEAVLGQSFSMKTEDSHHSVPQLQLAPSEERDGVSFKDSRPIPFSFSEKG